MIEKSLESKILKLSAETKQFATTLVMEYQNYINAGLQPGVAYQYLEMKYKDEIVLNPPGDYS